MMANQRKVISIQKDLNFFRNLAILVFIIKILILFRISPLTNWSYQGRMWLGADGENYLVGVNALSQDGILSKSEILNYWPAGYPIFIYIFGIFGKLNALTVLGLVQSAIFSFAVFRFSLELYRNNYRKVSKILSIFLLFNPTLSLSSLSIGYESICASGFLFVLALGISEIINVREKPNNKNIIIIGLTLSFIGALQPRLLISGIAIAFIISFTRKNIVISLVRSLCVTLIISSLPFSLIMRNHFASGLNVLSLNLGVTMSIGAGDDATGMYRGSWKGVPCKYNQANRVQADNAQVRCVMKWYLEHPKKSAQLFLNKTIYYWSPWIGPESKGTMARNPWFQKNPIKSIAQTQQGFKLVYGPFGIFVSWLWVLLSFSLMILGLIQLLKTSVSTKKLGLLLIAIIFPSWFVTLFTLGDNRFRLPTLGAVITLQVVGLIYSWIKLNGRRTVTYFP